MMLACLLNKLFLILFCTPAADSHESPPHSNHSFLKYSVNYLM
jgi:hypothetical protein